jgi:nucleoside-diphosphate-sugar epimerase
MTKFTVIGGHGFIGSEVVSHLKKEHHLVFAPKIIDERIYKDDLGIIIYCAGNGDCKNQPQKVVDSNLILLARLLSDSVFDRLIYLSSNRVYINQKSSNEDSNLTITSNDPRRLFNLSKLSAEELLLKSNKNTTILRLSNVYGLALSSPLFLPAITRDALINGKVDMHVSPEYAKDYISVYDVAKLILDISLTAAPNNIINIASGINISALQISNVLKKETSCKVVWHENSLVETFPITDISIIKSQFGFTPKSVLADLSKLVSEFKKQLL